MVDDGASTEHTVDSATPIFESLLSVTEDKQKTEEPPVQKSPEPESEAEETEASTEQAESAEDKSDAPEESTEAVEEQPTEVLYPVKINGVEEMVTLDELQKGFSRSKDYTQKTQALAEQRKQLETEIPAVRAEREKLANQLIQLDQAIAEATPEEPDWAKLQQEQPDQFPLVWASWQAAEKRRAVVRQHRDEAINAVEQDRLQVHQSYLNEQKAKLVEAIPEWKNADTAKSEKVKLAAFAKTAGYTAEELDGVMDHRAIVLLRDAMKWREAQSKRPAVQQKIEKVKAATPGAGIETAQVSEATRAKQRLAKTGKREDAAAAFLAMGIAD